MKRILSGWVLICVVFCFMSCARENEEPYTLATEETTLMERLQNGFGDAYDDLEIGLLMEGSAESYWKLNGNTITLFGNGAFASSAAGFFPWKVVSDRVKEIRIEKGVTYLGAYGFRGCHMLEEIIIDDGSFEGMGMGCFSNNISLRSVDLGDSLLKIPDEAFIGCTALTEIYVPATVSEIGLDAFSNCHSLDTVRYGGSPQEWELIAIEEGNEALERAEIVFE